VVRRYLANIVQRTPVQMNSRTGVNVIEANVVKPNIKTNNGLILVIDTLLIPKS